MKSRKLLSSVCLSVFSPIVVVVAATTTTNTTTREALQALAEPLEIDEDKVP